MRRRLSRSIFVLFVVAATLTAPAVNARSLNDDQTPRGGRDVPRIVKVIKQIIRVITRPTDDGNQIAPPHP
jgi:hypothetical protein